MPSGTYGGLETTTSTVPSHSGSASARSPRHDPGVGRADARRGCAAPRRTPPGSARRRRPRRPGARAAIDRAIAPLPVPRSTARPPVGQPAAGRARRAPRSPAAARRRRDRRASSMRRNARGAGQVLQRLPRAAPEDQRRGSGPRRAAAARSPISASAWARPRRDAEHVREQQLRVDPRVRARRRAGGARRPRAAARRRAAAPGRSRVRLRRGRGGGPPRPPRSRRRRSARARRRARRRGCTPCSRCGGR